MSIEFDRLLLLLVKIHSKQPDGLLRRIERRLLTGFVRRDKLALVPGILVGLVGLRCLAGRPGQPRRVLPALIPFTLD
jgi:hypothetical protein